jgi:hypothetical protein
MWHGARLEDHQPRYLLPWNHPDRWPGGSRTHVRPWLLRLCRIDRIALRRLPPGPVREIVALQLRCRQRSLARGWLSRRIYTYGASKLPADIDALHDELDRQARAREADETAWRSLEAKLKRPDPLEVVRRRAGAMRPPRPRRRETAH